MNSSLARRRRLRVGQWIAATGWIVMVMGAGAVSPPAPAAETAPGATWSFAPERDPFADDAAIDLRFLNERVAGERGFVRLDGQGGFALGDGTPVRFWCVNTFVDRERPWVARPRWPERRAPDLAYHARFLAKRGVNMVRLHAHINPPLPRAGAGGRQPRLHDVDAGEVDWIRRTVAAMKREGIYVTVSPYWANTMRSDDRAWGTDWGGNHHGLLFFDEKLQAAYKAWLRELFTSPNPHDPERLPLARDPAIALIQIQNEDSLLFWTVNNLKGGPRERLGRQFAAWAARRHGSLDRALAAWGGHALEGDRPREGVLDFFNIWEFTAPAKAQGLGRTPRHADQLRFWTERMHAFNTEIARFLRDELGCRQLINAGNWKTADDGLLNDAERWSYTANEVLATNRYFGGAHDGEHRGWAIVPGDTFTNDSVLTNAALQFPLNLKHAAGRPMLVTESGWVFPNRYAAEAPFLVAAYGALTGFDGFYWFAIGTEGFTSPRSANGYNDSQMKWTFGGPDVLGQFPAAALLFRRGDVRRGEPVVIEHRALDDLWQRRDPIIAEASGFDPNRDADFPRGSGVTTPVDPRAFLVGPVQVHYDSDPARSRTIDLSDYITEGGARIRSITGELELHTGEGWSTLDTPRAQGVTAFFDRAGPTGREFRLSSTLIASRNHYAAVLVVALDDRPLATARRVLVQVGTEARPAGWREEPVGEGRFRVVSHGGPPWEVVRAAVEVGIANPALTRASALDPNGRRTGEVPLVRTAGGVRFQFPSDALYVVVE